MPRLSLVSGSRIISGDKRKASLTMCRSRIPHTFTHMFGFDELMPKLEVDGRRYVTQWRVGPKDYFALVFLFFFIFYFWFGLVCTGFLLPLYFVPICLALIFLIRLFHDKKNIETIPPKKGIESIKAEHTLPPGPHQSGVKKNKQTTKTARRLAHTVLISMSQGLLFWFIFMLFIYLLLQSALQG